MKYTSSFMHSS